MGEDFNTGLLKPLSDRGVDTLGVEIRRGSKTFRWQGRYEGAMNEAETVAVELNVLAEKGGVVPPKFADSDYVFLANTHPTLQRDYARQFPNAKLIVCDTMNLWIENEPDELRKALALVHGLVLNEGEARLLTGLGNLVSAGLQILKMGPRFVIIKKGEHGSLLVSHDDLCVIPAYPTQNARRSDRLRRHLRWRVHGLPHLPGQPRSRDAPRGNGSWFRRRLLRDRILLHRCLGRSDTGTRGRTSGGPLPHGAV